MAAGFEKHFKENEERFWKALGPVKFSLDDKVNCWYWNGPKKNKRGGTSRNKLRPFFWARKDDGRLTQLAANRFAWRLAFGFWLDSNEWLIRTKKDGGCNDPECISPFHRTVSSREDWCEDRYEKPVVTVPEAKPRRRIPTPEEFEPPPKRVH